MVANLDNGTWILIPLSCWRIIQQMDKNNILLEEIYANAYDYEDERYLRDIIEKLFAHKFDIGTYQDLIKHNQKFKNMILDSQE